MTRRGAALILAGGVAVGAAAAAAARRSPAPPAAHVTALHAVAGVCFVAVGAFSTVRRSSDRVGLLMCAVGVTWFIPDLGFLPSSAAVTVALLEGTLAYGLLAHLFVSFPSGHVRPGLDRTAVITVYVWTALGNLVPDTLFAPLTAPCDCPHNLLVLHRDAAAHTLAVNMHQLANVGLAMLVFAIVVGHWQRATPPARRTLSPVAWTSGPIELAIIALNVVGVVGGLDGLRSITPTLTPLALMTLPLGFLAGLLRAHITHGSVGALVIELGRGGRTSLREALARALADPSLEIAYWRGAAQQWVDVSGTPVRLPDRPDGRATTLVAREGVAAAALVHDPSLVDDPWLLDAVTAAAGLALDNERLRADVAARLEEVRASRARLIEAQDEARRQIERDLHDGAQQRLVAVLLTLELARTQAQADGAARVSAVIDEALAQQRRALDDLRRLASGIHPAILTDGGLRPALHALAELAPVTVELGTVPAERLSRPVESAAYFVVCEALANVGKHARATRARVEVVCEDGLLHVQVRDDGVGGADPREGTGLRGLADRVAALDGRITVESPAAGGTRVTADIPCA